MTCTDCEGVTVTDGRPMVCGSCGEPLPMATVTPERSGGPVPEVLPAIATRRRLPRDPRSIRAER